MSSGNGLDSRDTTYNPSIARLTVDDGFQKMFQVKMASGRWFRGGKEDEHNYIINETAAREFNMHAPVIGQRFTWGGDTGQVIGIVKDFHYKSMHEAIGLMVLMNGDSYSSYIFAKTVPANISKAIGAAESGGPNMFQPALYHHFLDDSFNTLYKTDIKTAQLMFVFSLIAIIIAALGLFGLAAFTAERRTKKLAYERCWASVQQITGLLFKGVYTAGDDRHRNCIANCLVGNASLAAGFRVPH